MHHAHDPFDTFSRWQREAAVANPDVTQAVLATATTTGLPSARVVLVKHYDEHGFVFFTNYESRKGFEVESNPHAALVFHWREPERQVRIEGTVHRTDDDTSDQYWLSRPRGSQLSAFVSNQSRPVADRRALIDRVARQREIFVDQVIERPRHWGGYVVAPTRIEFWSGCPDRLHDRVVYTKEDGGWTTTLVEP